MMRGAILEASEDQYSNHPEMVTQTTRMPKEIMTAARTVFYPKLTLLSLTI